MLAFTALQTKEDREKLSYIKVEFPQSNKGTFPYPVLTKHRFLSWSKHQDLYNKAVPPATGLKCAVMYIFTGDKSTKNS